MTDKETEDLVAECRSRVEELDTLSTVLRVKLDTLKAPAHVADAIEAADVARRRRDYLCGVLFASRLNVVRVNRKREQEGGAF